MRIAIIGNGDFVPAKTQLLSYDCVIAADGGLRHCQQLGITPHHCIGDGDSLTPADKTLAQVQISEDQNTTDLQKALALAEHVAGNETYIVDLFSMTSGDRLDHSLFALQHLIHNRHITALYTPHQLIRSIYTTYTWHNASGRTVSLMPFGMAALVELVGFAWSGSPVVLDSFHPGISNVITADPATVSVQAGPVLSLEPVLWT